MVFFVAYPPPPPRKKKNKSSQNDVMKRTGCWEDVILDALPLVDDLFDSLTWRSMGLQRYRAVVVPRFDIQDG